MNPKEKNLGAGPFVRCMLKTYAYLILRSLLAGTFGFFVLLTWGNVFYDVDFGRLTDPENLSAMQACCFAFGCIHFFLSSMKLW